MGNTAPDDGELLRRLAAGWDREAIATLFDRHASRFLVALRRRGFAQADAEDVLQNCFVRLMTAGPALERVQNPRAYLWRMLFNAASDAAGNSRLLREAEPYNPGDPESYEAEVASASRDDPALALDVDRCVSEAWDRLMQTAPERAQALEWIVIDGLSGHEVAQLLNRSYGATREYLSQCRTVLRSLVVQVCPDWSKDQQ